MKRPLSVTIIGILYLFSMSSIIFSIFFAVNNQTAEIMTNMLKVPYRTYLIYNWLAGGLNLAIGVGLLSRKNWARITLFVSAPIIIILSSLIMKTTVFVLISIPYYGACVYFLTRENVHRYFSMAEEDVVKHEDHTVRSTRPRKRVSLPRKIFSVLCYIVGAYFLLTLIFSITLASAENQMAFLLLFAVFGVLGAIFTLTGLLMWGKDRWKMSLGSFLTAIGVFIASYAVFHVYPVK